MDDIVVLGVMKGGYEMPNRVYSGEGISPSIRTFQGGSLEHKTIETRQCEDLDDWTWVVDGVRYKIRIRKLTPKECWRLMGCSDEDFEKAASVNSNTQLYKQAGNSIVVDVLENLFKELIYGEETEECAD